MTSGGAERVMSEIANFAAEHEVEVYIILISENIVRFKLHPNIHLLPICDKNRESNRLLKVWMRAKLMRQEFKRIQPNIIVSFLTLTNIYACIANIQTQIPLVISERNDPKRDPQSILKKIIRKLVYPLANGYIFQTDEAKNYFSNRIQDSAIVIPNPVKNNLPLSCRKKTKKEICAIGRLTDQKNYPLLLAAFSQFYREYSDYSLHIFGEGENETELKRMVKVLGIDKNVFLEGVISDIHYRIKDMGMYVLSSNYEGISNALMEAMALGLPCISTDCPCGGSRHLITNGKNGLLVPVGDVEAMVDAMKKIVTDQKLADRLSVNAVSIRNTHSLDKITNKFFNYFEQVLNTRRN